MKLTKDHVRIAAEETEKRQYTIEGPPDQLDELETLLDWIHKLSSWGHSASAEIFVDGDGAAKLKIEGLFVNMEEHPDYKENAWDKPELSLGIGV